MSSSKPDNTDRVFSNAESSAVSVDLATLSTQPTAPNSNKIREKLAVSVALSKQVLRPVDIFVLLNTILFILLCFFTYYDRFVVYRGAANIHEFFIYATAILASIVFLWIYFRHYELEPRLLVLLELGILMHFAGAFVNFGEYRLYDIYLAGIRYDKYVHFVNAFIGAALIWKLCSFRNVPLYGVNILIVPLVVLGLGSIIEILEYMVVVTVERNGVGGYDNNMQDLVANLLGSTISTCLIRFRQARLENH